MRTKLYSFIINIVEYIVEFVFKEKLHLSIAILLLFTGFGMAQGDLVITNVYPVNVTPFQFDVFFQTQIPAKSEIEIYADSAGITNLAGSVGVELCAVESGNSDRTNAVDARISRREIAGEMYAKGLSLIRVSGCSPDTSYYFRLKAYTNGILAATWPGSGGLYAVTTALKNSFITDARQLLVSVPGADAAGCVGILGYAGAAYPLASVVGDRASDRELHFDLSNFFDATGSNLTFSGNEEFSIVVYGSSTNARTSRDYSVGFDTNMVVADAIPLISDATYLLLGMGSTNILSNVAAANIPIQLVSAPLTTNLSFELTIPSSALTNIAVTAVSPDIGGAQAESLGNNRWRVVLKAVPGSAIHSTTLEEKTVALLNFKPTPDVLTVLVPLTPTAFSAISPTNEVHTDSIIIDGKVQVITRRPYVEWNDEGSLQQISVSGIPGTEYNVEFSTNLLSDVWEVTTNFVLGAEELQTDIQLPPNEERIYFIRIKEKTIE